MTPRDLLRAWLELSEAPLSVKTYCDRRTDLWAATHRGPLLFERGGLIDRWRKLDSEAENGWDQHPLLSLDPSTLEPYWTARKALEADTRAYLEMETR